MLLNPLTQLLPATITLAAVALYCAGWASLRGSRVPWPRARGACFLGGAAVVAAGVVLPGVSPDHAHDPRLHMTAHLLLGMVGPLLIAVSAPVTLALRTLRRPARRRLGALLRSTAIRAIGHPVTAVTLSGGGLLVLYLTPLHARALHDPLLALVVQAHVVLAGTLFAWAVAGVDRVPRRPSFAVRGAALAAGLVVHTALSRLLMADVDRLADQAGGTPAEWRTAAEIMWFEGDLVELALVVVFFAQAHRAATWPWRPRSAATG